MILYQFQRIDERGHTLDNIKNRQLWFSSPFGFNDPFDPIVRIGNQYDEDVFKVCVNFYNKFINEGKELQDYELMFLFPSIDGQEGDSPYPSFSESINFILKGRPSLQVRLLEEIKRVIGENCFAINTFLSIYSDLGISCFSKAWYEPVMWAHYASNHTGICVKYYIDESKLDPRTKLISVRYSDEIPSYTYVSHDTGLDGSTLEEHIGNKSTPWSYEKEVRIINKTGSNLPLPIPGKIISICYGLRTTTEQKAKVEEAVGKDSGILLGSVTMSSDYRKFDWVCSRLNSDKLDIMYYTPSLESS